MATKLMANKKSTSHGSDASVVDCAAAHIRAAVVAAARGHLRERTLGRSGLSGVDMPNELPPQHAIVPSVWMPRACGVPALTCKKINAQCHE